MLGTQGGTALQDDTVPSGSSPHSFRLVVRGLVPVERDMKHALSCCSCKTTPPFWMPARAAAFCVNLRAQRLWPSAFLLLGAAGCQTTSLTRTPTKQTLRARCVRKELARRAGVLAHLSAVSARRVRLGKPHVDPEAAWIEQGRSRRLTGRPRGRVHRHRRDLAAGAEHHEYREHDCRA